MLPVRSGGRLSVSPLALVPGDADVSPVARPALVSPKRVGKPAHTADDAAPVLAAAGFVIAVTGSSIPVPEAASNGSAPPIVEATLIDAPSSAAEPTEAPPSASGKGSE